MGKSTIFMAHDDLGNLQILGMALGWQPVKASWCGNEFAGILLGQKTGLNYCPDAIQRKI